MKVDFKDQSQSIRTNPIYTEFVWTFCDVWLWWSVYAHGLTPILWLFCHYWSNLVLLFLKLASTEGLLYKRHYWMKSRKHWMWYSPLLLNPTGHDWESKMLPYGCGTQCELLLPAGPGSVCCLWLSHFSYCTLKMMTELHFLLFKSLVITYLKKVYTVCGSSL